MERVGADLVLLKSKGHVCLLRSGLVQLGFSPLALSAIWVSVAGPLTPWEALHKSEQ